LAHLVVSARAREDLARLIFTHRLPADRRRRVQRSIEHLRFAPQAGQALSGEWEGFQEIDAVAIVAIYDGRSDGSPRP
jgi:hypothetical protein